MATGLSPVVAYKSPLVLGLVRSEIAEPYRTFLLIHAGLKKTRRDELANVLLSEVDADASAVRIRGQVLNAKSRADLVSYLRGYLSKVPTLYLFPLPTDPEKPLNVGVAKRQINDIIGRATGAPAETE